MTDDRDKNLWTKITTDPSWKYDAIIVAPFIAVMMSLYWLGVLR